MSAAPVVIGWRALKGENIAHYWKLRNIFSTAVSACFILCTDPLQFSEQEYPHCAACTEMEEIRSQLNPNLFS